MSFIKGITIFSSTRSVLKKRLPYLLNNPFPVDLCYLYVLSPHMYVLKSVPGLFHSTDLSNCVPNLVLHNFLERVNLVLYYLFKNLLISPYFFLMNCRIIHYTVK